jgi:hypothetical protein
VVTLTTPDDSSPRIPWSYSGNDARQTSRPRRVLPMTTTAAGLNSNPLGHRHLYTFYVS